MNNYMEKTVQNWANVEETAQTTQKVSDSTIAFYAIHTNYIL